MSAVIDSLPPPGRPAYTPVQRAHRRRVAFLRWLRRIHLYVGLWGAMLGLLFGATGLLMNHRAVMKIPVEKAVQRTVQMQLPEAQVFRSAEEMARWLEAELALGSLQGRIKAEPPRRVSWGDREVQQPARWQFSWFGVHRSITAEYFVGNRFIKLETQDATPIGALMRLHTASGAGVFWVLLSDTIAGGLILLCITGLLLWTRLHPVKLPAVGVSLAAVLGALWFLWSAA